MATSASWGDNLTPPDRDKPHTFDHPQENTVVAYHRDRREPWKNTAPWHTKDRRELTGAAGPFIYLYDTQAACWTYTGNIRFRRFTKPVMK